MSHIQPSFRTISNGAHAHRLLQLQCKRLVDLHGPVLEDKDPEPLHQMRVSMRRLRTGLAQFGPCLLLPHAVSDQRLAKSVRRLGMARDLDVLRDRLEHVLLPQLSEQEQQRLKPVRRQLARERRLAQEHLQSVLQSSRHLELIAKLQAWLRQPSYTALGEQPLVDWLAEWRLPGSTSLGLHPGWWLQSPQEDVETLHDLRKRIKTVRYQLENLTELSDSRGRSWIAALKQGQSLLGELNDLQVLSEAIRHQLDHELERYLPHLAALLDQQRLQCWRAWRHLATTLMQRHQRRRRVASLGMGSTRPHSRAALIDFGSRFGYRS